MSNTPYLMGSFAAASGGSLTPAVSLTTGNAAGDNILVYVLATAGSTAPTVTDTRGQTYTMSLEKSPATGLQLYCFENLGAAALTAGTDTLTVTFQATGAQAVLVIGDNGVSPQVDVLTGATGSGTTASVSSGTFPTAEEHVLAVAATTGTSTPSFSAPFSTSLGSATATGARLAAAYDDVTSTGSVTASATVASGNWAIIVLSSPALTPTPSLSLSDGVAGEVYSQTLEVTGGVSPYTWSVVSGSLPAGLTLASGVISGTPTTAGTSSFTLQVTDTHGVIGTSSQTIVILASGAGGSPATSVPNNILTPADSDFEVTGSTWVADVNANAPVRSSHTSLTGSESLSWTSVADGLTQICTGFYACKPSTSYILGGFLLPAGMNDAYWGIKWYTSGGTLISTTWGPDNQTNSSIEWQAGYGAFTSPPNAAKMKFAVQVAQSNKGDMNHIDFVYSNQSQHQVLIDWLNPPFASGSIAGQDFMDVSPWIRMDNGITLQRGRQDAISEITSGAASFELQNDNGMFRRQNTTAIPYVIGGDITLQRRVQVNLTDETATFWTRFDGPVAEIDYAGENTGNTDIATFSVADVLAPMSRQDSLKSWTVEQTKFLGPLFHWTLNDAGNAGGAGLAAETSGNNGPPMRVWNSDTSGAAAIAWQDSTGGVETQADAVTPGAGPALQQGVQAADGSEYWSAGTSQPNNQLRGLDSHVQGPYGTPLQSVLFTPLLSNKTVNYFVGNTGYQLQATLPPSDIIAPLAADGLHDFAIEMWFTMGQTSAGSYVTTGIPGSLGKAVGPFIALSLGSTRYKNTLVAGLWVTGGSPMTFEVATYSQPPAWAGLNGLSGATPPGVVQSCSTSITPDSAPIPHHLVLNVAGDPSSPTVTAFLDGASIGSIPLSKQQVFDTVCVGGAFGGTGCWCGNLSNVSVYNYQLSQSQITLNCQLGQYGMWECTTDDCIAQLANYANLPSFWNNLQGNHNGLTLTEYQDITGSNALSNMQVYEQLEMGLLYTDAQGRLNFNTRDARMGKRGPDLYLPPDTFDNTQMGWETIDQFQVNEQAVASQIFATGTGYVNQASQAKYGVYATNALDSPASLAIISWNRAMASMEPAGGTTSGTGLSSYAYWPDPYMYDYAAWLANSRSDPWMLPAQVTIDLMSRDVVTSAPKISQYYALEIGDVIAPSGALPSNYPNANLSMEWFIEGINETITQNSRTIQFYTSPAEPQRAWIPGDATYGCLDSTARIGVSAPDTHVIQAIGKDVAHDAGRPYWPPSFSTTMNNPSGSGNSFIGALDIRGLTDNLNLALNPPMCVVSQLQWTQALATGSLSQPQVGWDAIHVDTVGGMGAMPGWPNWYVCLVPGFYEIDVSLVWGTSGANGGSLMQAWIAVASQAAQALAAGKANPVTVDYVCPIGEGVRENTVGMNSTCAPTTRIYLGLGDMVALCCEQGTGGTANTAIGNTGSHMSLRWVGYGESSDQCQYNSTINGGTVTAQEVITTQTKTYTNSACYSYFGASASTANKYMIRDGDDSPLFQGTWDADNGSQYGQVVMPYRTMCTDMPLGTSINWATLTFSITSTYYSSGGKLMLGSCYSTPGENPWHPGGNSKNTNDIQTLAVPGGAGTYTMPITTRFVQDFVASNGGGSSMTAFWIGNDSTTNKEYSIGYNGRVGAWTLTVNFTT